MKQLYNNTTFLRSNFISLVWFCLNKSSLILFSKVWLKIKPLLWGATVVLCTPWDQSVSSNWRCDFSSYSSSELVNSESSWYISSILVVKVVNAFYLYLRVPKFCYNLCLIHGLTWLTGFVFVVIILLTTVCIANMFCAMRCWVSFL